MLTASRERIPHDPRTSIYAFSGERPAFPFRWHFHPEVELTFIRAGHGRRFVGSTVEAYRAPEVVLLGTDLPHTWLSTSEDNAATVIQFGAPITTTMLEAPELASVARLLERARRGLVFAEPLALAAEIERIEALRDLERLPPLLALLQRLANLPARVISGSGAEAFVTPEHRRVVGVCEFIAARHAEPLTRLDVARVAHLSPSAFSRFFARATGRSFRRYLNEVRVDAARRRLLAGDESVSAIAHAVGYRNLANFNRQFRAVAGLSPTELRKSFVDAATTPGREADGFSDVRATGIRVSGFRSAPKESAD